MFKCYTMVSTCLICIILSLGFAGCAKVKELPEMPVPSVSIVQEPDTAEFDYNPYLKKIWIVGDENQSPYQLSFIISKVENGIIEGKFSMNGVMNPCYNTITNWGWGNFVGTISNGVAECFFVRDDSVRMIGKIGFGQTGAYRARAMFEFKSKNEIVVTVDYAEYYNAPLVSGTFLYNPDNFDNLVSDNQHLTLTEETSYSFVSEYWGNSTLVTAVFLNPTSGNKTLVAYLLDDENNILCDFRERIGLADKFVDVVIDDCDNDGLTDIKFTIAPYVFEIDDSTTDPAQYYDVIFYQVENGWFYAVNPD